MKTGFFTDGEYLNAAVMNLMTADASGAAAETGGVWGQPGLVRPDVLTWAASGLSLTLTAPPPFLVRFGNGATAGAHGTNNGADTQNSTISFSGLVPASGPPINAYIVAGLTTIEQTVVPIIGPPPSNPAFNPNFVPFTSYQEAVTSLNVFATTTVPDGVNYIEIARTSLVSGQASIGLGNLIYSFQQLASRIPTIQTAVVVGTITLTATGAGTLQLISAAGLTLTLPPAATSNGLIFFFASTGYTGLSTVAAAGSDKIYGVIGSPGFAGSVTVSGGVAFSVVAAGGSWYAQSAGPNWLLAQPNTWVSPQTFIDPNGIGGVIVSGTSVNGATIRLTDTLASATAPTKWLRVLNNNFAVVNSGFSAEIFTLTDAGNVENVNSVQALGFDDGGLGGQFRAVQGNYGFIIRNDGVDSYLLLTNAGSPFGTWNNFRPLVINNSNGAVVLDSGGLGGTTVGGALTVVGSETVEGSLTVDTNLNVEGSAEVVGNFTVVEDLFVGTSGQFYLAQSGGNYFLNFQNNNYIEFNPNVGLNIETGGFINLGAPAGVNVSNNLVVAGTTTAAQLTSTGNIDAVSTVAAAQVNSTGGINAAGTYTGGAVNVAGNVQGATVDATNGNVTANGGYARATFGLKSNPTDLNACIIGNDYANANFSGVGHQQLPNGFIIQWGQLALNAGSTTSNFDVEFTSSALVTTATWGGTAPPIGGYLSSYSPNRAQITVTIEGVSSGPFAVNYIALGF